MATTPIQAVDERVLPFAPDQIWPVLADVNGYPQWYPPSLHLQVRAVTADGIGSEVELRPRGGRTFRCRVESREAPRRLRLRYPGEFIVGTGEWRLDAAPGGTRVTYELDVVAPGRLAVLLGWLLPLGKIHSKFMREVLECLERETERRSSAPLSPLSMAELGASAAQQKKDAFATSPRAKGKPWVS